MSSAPAQEERTGGQPRPTLTVFDAVAMIVGIVIGVGIFKAPAIVAGTFQAKPPSLHCGSSGA